MSHFGPSPPLKKVREKCRATQRSSRTHSFEGISGVATFVRKSLTHHAQNVFGCDKFDREGRVVRTGPLAEKRPSVLVLIVNQI
jgi:exonuclease III